MSARGARAAARTRWSAAWFPLALLALAAPAAGQSSGNGLDAGAGGPELALSGDPVAGQGSVRVVVANHGDQATGPLHVTARIVPADQACPDPNGVDAGDTGPAQTLSDLGPGQTVPVAFPIPDDLTGETVRVCITLRPEHAEMGHASVPPSRTWRLQTEASPAPGPSPPIAPLAIGVGLALALLLGAGWLYVRIYRNPVVTRTREQPEAIKSYALSDLPEVDSALTRALQRATTLTAAQISEVRWKRAVEAASAPEAALNSVAEAVGGTLGPALGQDAGDPHRLPASAVARALALPGLRLRFARVTALAAVSGPELEDGAARALIEALHQGGRGPRQALVLDLTEAQDARRRLDAAAPVQIVTLSQDTVRDLLLADEPAHSLEAALRAQIPLVELSPYQTASGVDQDSLFFGRDEQLRLMAGRTLRSFLLVGARQMGKTSLLKALARRLATRGDMAVRYLSLDRAGDLTGHMARSLGHATGEAASGATGDESAEIETRAGRFRALAAGTRERPRLWLVDEADMFVKDDAAHGYAITGVMRQLTLDGLAYFVLAGYWELYAATAFDYQHPLLNFAELVRLDPLDERAAERLATEPLEALGLTWDDPGTVQHLVRGAGRRANLIVLACKGMLHALDRESRTLTREQLDQVVRTDRDLGDALRVDRRLDVLDRALVYQALAMDDAPRFGDVVTALRGHGLTAPTTELERSRERVILAYVLVEDGDGRLRCPVPFLEERLRRDGDLADRARELATEWEPG